MKLRYNPILCFIIFLLLLSPRAVANQYDIPQIQFPSVQAEPQELEHVEPKAIEDAAHADAIDQGESPNALAGDPMDAKIDEILKDLASNYWKGQIEQEIRKARVAIKLRQFDEAEEAYINALNRQMSEDERKQILMEMIEVYGRLGIDSKKAAIMEKYLELYPKGPKTPEILFELGRLYRTMGAYETSISRFYEILNMSLGVQGEALQKLKRQSMQAQLEIAETYFLMKDYKQAHVFFDRLRRLDISKANKINVDFKFAYTLFQEGRFIDAIAEFDAFLLKYPESNLVPEVRFLKAMTLKRMGKSEEAVDEVTHLVMHGDLSDDEHEQLWQYWQKKTANQIANEFYNQEDYLSALRVYQAMLPLSADARWQWPIIYQMGLCFEKLSMQPMALQSYEVILKGEEWDLSEDGMDEYLKNIREMAAWRKEHLKWFVETDAKLEHLLKPQVTKTEPSA